MKAKISILFYAKTCKSTKNSLTPIYLRITINGVRIELSTSKYIDVTKWSPEAGKMKGQTQEARTINSYLDILRNKVYETEKYMINNEISISAESFKNQYLGIEEKQFSFGSSTNGKTDHFFLIVILMQVSLNLQHKVSFFIIFFVLRLY